LAQLQAAFRPKAYMLLSQAYQFRGCDDEALRICQEGKALHPGSLEILFQEGVVLFAKREFEMAKVAFRGVIDGKDMLSFTGVDMTMRRCRARDYLGHIGFAMRQFVEAGRQWRASVDESPQFEKAWLALLEVYLAEDNRLEANAVLAKADRSPSRLTIIPALEARLLIADGRVSAARRLLEDAVERSPMSVWLHFVLADVVFRLCNDRGAAERHLRRILEMAPLELASLRKLAEIEASSKVSEGPYGALAWKASSIRESS
jgi:tetratricopeptide (TPR) repeat protein